MSPDGLWLVFDENTTAGGEVWRLSLERAGSPAADAPVLLVQRLNGQIAPDGKWIAYISLVSGRNEIYVQAFPGPGPRQPISTAGGVSVLWSRDGQELFFTTPDQLFLVDISTTPTFSASAPRVLFEGRYRETVNGNTPFSVSADGRRFLRIQQVQPDRAVAHIDLVLNWLAELEQAAAGK